MIGESSTGLPTGTRGPQGEDDSEKPGEFHITGSQVPSNTENRNLQFRLQYSHLAKYIFICRLGEIKAGFNASHALSSDRESQTQFIPFIDW